jgi:hypothetical protein
VEPRDDSADPVGDRRHPGAALDSSAEIQIHNVASGVLRVAKAVSAYPRPRAAAVHSA